MEKSKSNQSNDSILAEKSKDDDETQPDDQSGLLTKSDNVEDAMLDECENLGTESENEKSIEERLRSASLTGSIHEMTDDVRRISLDRRLSLEQANLEEDLDQDDEELFVDASDTSPVRRSTSKETSPAAEDLTLSPTWRYKKKHFFILSDAGKPIYSRYGDEDQLASLMAVMQATVSFVQDMSDNIRAIKSNGTSIVFLNRKPLILVAVSHTTESPTQLIVQLTYLYHQVLSVLTLNHIARIFEEKKGYDLRKMIAGSERLLDSLSNSMDQDPSSYVLSAVRVLPIQSSLRESVSSVIKQCCSKAQNVVFALLIAENQLITLVRMKDYFIHPADLHLIFNLVSSSESFKLSESWTPICLPKFDSSGFMHAHVSYLSDDSPVCLFMLTVERDIFFKLSEARQKIVTALEKNGNGKKVEDLVKNQITKLDPKEIGTPEIRHYMYKSKNTAQFLSAPDLSDMKPEALSRLQNIYFIMKSRLHSPTRPCKLMYYSGSMENVIAWATPTFEIYATFEPITEKVDAFAAVNKLLKWIRKEENNLFILSSPTF